MFYKQSKMINHNNNNKSCNSIKNYVDSIVNKSFLILDQIHESYFPFLEKSIYLSHSVEKIDKLKISKTEFIIQQRIKHVENNCQQLDFIISKLPDTDPSKVDLTNRLKQLKCEQKRIWSAFKAIQFKRVEKDRLQREQEELLIRRFTNSNENNNDPTGNNGSLTIDIDHEDTSNKEKAHILKCSSSSSSSLSGNKLIRNQKPLVKRVRTRYLNFSTDFLGMTKVIVRYSYCANWLLLLAICLIFSGVFFLIIWQTSLTRRV